MNTELKLIVPDNQLNNYYPVCCQGCGWLGSSELLEGGGQIADTGDFGDIYCPKCYQIDPNQAETNYYYVVNGDKADALEQENQRLKDKLKSIEQLGWQSDDGKYFGYTGNQLLAVAQKMASQDLQQTDNDKETLKP